MSPIETKVKESLAIVQDLLGESDMIREFQNAIAEFDMLVKEGMTTRRGNQLLSPSDAHLVAPFAVDDENKG